MKALVFTPASLFRMTQFSISNEWFDRYDIPGDTAGLKRVKIGEVIYLLDDALDSDEKPIIIIALSGQNAIFGNAIPNSNTLERVITAARSIYSNSVTIPTGWRQHHEGSIFSIQAPDRERNWRARLHFDMRPRGTRDLFAFSRTDIIVDFTDLDKQLAIYDLARATLPDAILTSSEGPPDSSRAGIILSQRLPQGFVQGATLDEWYKSKLTSEQRTFVDKRHDGPVRLRGSAGTGKTLSLVIKFLRDARNAEVQKAPAKLGFLTHSFASVDLVNAIGESLDTTGLFYGQGEFCRLEVRTLYDLSQEYLHFSLEELKPLSLDGREGRRLQFELIQSVLKDLAKSPIFTLQYAEISPTIMLGWEAAAAGANKSLIIEIMNEFASVLDAEAIRAGEEKGEKYAKGTVQRPAWLMPLPSEPERRFILEIHRRYRKLLSDMNTLSVDQMIADFNSFLNSNRWDSVRSRLGYDALFVDELHLFTSIERQTLHKLIKRNIEDDGRPRRPPIFMAYDLKQSPRDTFSQYGEADQSLFSGSTGLQNSELVKLERVFRYTPQIAEFLSDLDATFPAIDIPGEWDAYAGKAELQDGSIPELTVFPDDRSLFKTVFSAAEKVARSIDGGGRRVAVLCASEEKFDQYVIAASGQYAGRHIPIASREPSSELRHAGKRFVLSMPEFVAGLQFDTVFLIHVDVEEAPPDSNDGVRRRLISSIYLGASRAERTLRLSACLSRGGMSDILQMALDRHSLRLVSHTDTTRNRPLTYSDVLPS